jgi:Cu/Zn superoxide dismutase
VSAHIDTRRPPFNLAAVDEAKALDARALVLHREADDCRDIDRRASLRRVACDLEQQADRLVPVEYRQ